MKVVVTGSSGLIGSSLVGALRRAGHTALRLVRHGRPGPEEVAWDPERGTIGAAALEGVDAVVDHGNVQQVRLSVAPQVFLARLAQRTTVRRFEITRPSLHDIFIDIARPSAEQDTPRAE